MAQYIMSESHKHAHYNDVIMSAMASQITGVSIIYLTVSFVQAQIKENIKTPRHWPFIGDRWIPHTKGPSNAKNVSIWWRHHEHSLCPRDVKSGGERPARINAHFHWDYPYTSPCRVKLGQLCRQLCVYILMGNAK